MKTRLDVALVVRGLVDSRSRADDLIRRGYVLVDGVVASKSAMTVSSQTRIKLKKHLDFVSRAGEKLASVADDLKLDFRGKTVLDVGSSTGGFSDFSLQNGAKRVIAVDVGTDQLSAKLRDSKRVELHEKTDIRDFVTDDHIDIVVADVSFISLRAVLPYIRDKLANPSTQIVAMLKPQFEAGEKQKNKGVIKNNTMRRQILADFELWLKQNRLMVVAKRDSGLAGTKGNLERFYLLKIVG